ncbi:HNH endonuclease [Rhizobium sp. NZLR5]|uniref:HNH endonuclease n=1 Tax=Rhizobium sp. NZLR5 TaxID=2731103 RepID=UPI001C8310E9|nr:HNH endonuclease [Rhizobium sp. NZLR5]MBX5186315.1 HNH endonuclease [Rhizobium sp. NZLR5]
MASLEETILFYEDRYDIIGQWFLTPGTKVVLGDSTNRRCRFCDRAEPEVWFKSVAHAIPESLGNKSIESMYECDDCNSFFGRGIENDLGNWSKPIRSLMRIRGKSGVPSLAKGGPKGWRIEYGEPSGFEIKQYEHDPIFSVDEQNRVVHFSLKRDSYTPVAVLKALMKIGLTLIPDEEVKNFAHLKNWVRHPDHSIPFVEGLPVLYTLQPGFMPPNKIAAFILRRKPGAQDCAYAYLVLSYGNETYQVMLPSAQHDGEQVSHAIYAFPTPGAMDPQTFLPPKVGRLDLTSREKKVGDIVHIDMGYVEAVSSPGG